MGRSKIDRTGEKKQMNDGNICEIIRYENIFDIDVVFNDTGEVIRNRQYSDFKRGRIKSHFSPTVYGIGIVGLERTDDEFGNKIKSYRTWQSMIERCYSKKSHKKRPTYKGCKVCDEWIYYSHFKEWYENNYYEVGNETMCLDKDILIKGNKLYSPDTCVFAPARINSLFTKRDSDRGKYPIGVHKVLKLNKYASALFIEGISSHIGLFNTPEEAFESYKEAKERYIKQIADEYKDKIPQNLYDAMYNYEVEITD